MKHKDSSHIIESRVNDVRVSYVIQLMSFSYPPIMFFVAQQIFSRCRWFPCVKASLMGMSPVISDQFDTVKDVVFAGLCFQSDRRSAERQNPSAWLGTAMGTTRNRWGRRERTIGKIGKLDFWERNREKIIENTLERLLGSILPEKLMIRMTNYWIWRETYF